MVKEKSEAEKVNQFLYQIAIKDEIYPENPDGESLAILQMLAEIRNFGYDYHYFADIKLRKITDKKLMEIMLKYYPQMESVFTKETILSKIDPNRFPVIRELAMKEYMEFSPYGRMDMSNLQKTIVKGKLSDSWLNQLLDLMNDPDFYASAIWIRERLVKTVPERMKPYSQKYSTGVLLVSTLDDFFQYKDKESLDILRKMAEITDEEVLIIRNDKSYKLCATMYEYYMKLCTSNFLKSEARRLLKKSAIC